MDCTRFSHDHEIYKSTQSMYVKAVEIKSQQLFIADKVLHSA